jgi:hypothetical protein
LDEIGETIAILGLVGVVDPCLRIAALLRTAREGGGEHHA